MDTTESALEPTWIRRIVVAADGSPASVRGLEQAADLAARVGAKVLVVHVRHVPTAALIGSGLSAPAVLETLDELESEVRQQAVRILGGSGATWDFVVRSGSAGEEIVGVVKETGADIVVVGSNRHSSLHNLLLGSTAAYLTAHSPAPVLVMRALGRVEVGAAK
jgi:nucleotide-binding universal stress UspA family protein